MSYFAHESSYIDEGCRIGDALARARTSDYHAPGTVRL